MNAARSFRTSPSGVPSASRQAVEHQLQEYHLARTARDEAEARLRNCSETLQILISTLPVDQKVEFEQRRLNLDGSGVIETRGGETFNNVVQLFARSRRREWSIPDVQAELTKSGFEAETKSVYNAVAYLARSGKLQRVSRGRYVVVGLGIGIDLDHDQYDGVSRLSEHDT